MKVPFFSIVIPVYNVGDYINECVDSILSQSYTDFEVILVDDGSTDDSGRICDKYTDRRVRVFHKANGGLSDARNYGISKVRGKYVAFIDSDDYISDFDLLLKSYEVLNNSDIDLLTFGYTKYFEVDKKKIEYIPNITDVLFKCDKFDLLSGDFLVLSAWGKFINSKLFEDNHLRFTYGVLSEDMDWCVELAKYINSCVVYRNASYIYRQREGSITRRPSESKLADLETNYIKSKSIISEIEDQREKELLKAYITRYYSMYIINLALMPRKVIKKHLDFAKKEIDILKYSKRSREVIINILLQVIGFRGTLFLIRIGYKYVKK